MGIWILATQQSPPVLALFLQMSYFTAKHVLYLFMIFAHVTFPATKVFFPALLCEGGQVTVLDLNFL